MSYRVDRFKRLFRKATVAFRAEFQAFARRGRVRPGVVLYESFAGNGALCNPEAIFRELLRSPEMGRLRHIWVLNTLNEHHAIQGEFAGNPRVSFVCRRTLGYFRALATSQYLINNATFPAEFSKRPGQVYLNTWHGTPLKRMGYDMPNGALDSANTLRNFITADFLLSQNSFMTEQMYATAYKLRGAFRGAVIETGYPRTDRQFLSRDELAATRALLLPREIAQSDTRIILYAPTWKGTDFGSPADDASLLLGRTEAIQREVGPQFVVLLKTHQAVHQFAADRPEFLGILVSNDVPSNLALGATDILITDYSSIFFDFLSLGRPMIFFVPDEVDYSSTRGLYFALNELPGATVGTVAELGEAVRALSSTATATTAEADTKAATAAVWRERFASHDDGGAALRVVNIVFRGHPAGELSTVLVDNPRTSILLSLGGMRSNGITNSALNLLNAIDHTVFDVSVIVNRPAGVQQLSNQQRIPAEVRQYLRVGGMNGSKFTHLRRRLRERFPAWRKHAESPAYRRMWADEWARCFGDARFDSLVDFSGYTAFWSLLLLHSPGGFRSIWLHNDLARETGRFVGSRQRMKRSLPAVFSLYARFDALTSVSESLTEINHAALGEKYGLSGASFRSARNLVDAGRVLNGLRAPLGTVTDYRAEYPGHEPDDRRWIEAMQQADNTVWFATVGRFSPEKNQARLVRAFAQVYRDNPLARLIIVGHGPLRAQLKALIEALGLEAVAFVVGPFPNPFPILAAANCFVLSSDYEGQPMVLLEAALAGMPIVTVEFDSVRDALPETGVHIVPQSDTGLVEGMLAFLRNEVAASALDAERYNSVAVAEFYAAVRADPRFLTEEFAGDSL